MSVTVRVRGLRKSFRDAHRTVEVLRGVDLDLEPGELVAVVGPSGSGKSTLLHLLGGLEPADAGEIEIGGRRIDGLSPRRLAEFRNRTLGYVFQFHQLLADFTALENVALPGRIAGLAPEELGRRAAALLGEVKLGELLDRFPGQLSSSSASRFAGRCCSSRRCCSPTSRRGVSIPPPAARCSSSSSIFSAAIGRPPSSSPTTRSWPVAVLGFWCSTTACSGTEVSDMQLLPGAGRG